MDSDNKSWTTQRITRMMLTIIWVIVSIMFCSWPFAILADCPYQIDFWRILIRSAIAFVIYAVGTFLLRLFISLVFADKSNHHIISAENLKIWRIAAYICSPDLLLASIFKTSKKYRNREEKDRIAIANNIANLLLTFSLLLVLLLIPKGYFSELQNPQSLSVFQIFIFVLFVRVVSRCVEIIVSFIEDVLPSDINDKVDSRLTPPARIGLSVLALFELLMFMIAIPNITRGQRNDNPFSKAFGFLSNRCGLFENAFYYYIMFTILIFTTFVIAQYLSIASSKKKPYILIMDHTSSKVIRKQRIKETKTNVFEFDINPDDYEVKQIEVAIELEGQYYKSESIVESPNYIVVPNIPYGNIYMGQSGHIVFRIPESGIPTIKVTY